MKKNVFLILIFIALIIVNCTSINSFKKDVQTEMESCESIANESERDKCFIKYGYQYREEALLTYIYSYAKTTNLSDEKKYASIAIRLFNTSLDFYKQIKIDKTSILDKIYYQLSFCYFVTNDFYLSKETFEKIINKSNFTIYNVYYAAKYLDFFVKNYDDLKNGNEEKYKQFYDLFTECVKDDYNAYTQLDDAIEKAKEETEYYISKSNYNKDYNIFYLITIALSSIKVFIY